MRSWLPQLLLACILGVAVLMCTEESTSLYSGASSTASQVQASRPSAPFTCTPSGVDWGTLQGHDQPQATVTCRNNGHWGLPLQAGIQNLPEVSVAPASLYIPTRSQGSLVVQLTGDTAGRYTNGRLVIEGNGQTVVIPIGYCRRGPGVPCR